MSQRQNSSGAASRFGRFAAKRRGFDHLDVST
jgi:hypothetical protein